MVLSGLFLITTAQTNALRFDPDTYTLQSLKMPDGSTVSYKAYEGIYYVTNVEDSTYQTMNVYVPEKIGVETSVPILFRTYVGGYMASTAKKPSGTDATGRALQEGYVVCIPGSRGSNSIVSKNGKNKYTGITPNGLLDLKAAVRYLHYNDELMPGDAERIFTDGTSAGGAMSALLGATGNCTKYESYLEKMGVAPGRDDVFAAICYCPITDLDHADSEYEWLYGCTNDGIRGLNDAQKTISSKLAAQCPPYIESLNLTTPDGKKLTADNYKEFLKQLLITSAHKALEAGVEIPDSIGIIFYQEKLSLPQGHRQREKGFQANKPRREDGMDGRGTPSFGPGNRTPSFNNRTDFVTDIDLDTYLSYVVSATPLKTPPAFDAWGILDNPASPENKAFGNEEGIPANFTTFSLCQHTHDDNTELDQTLRHRIYLMNPMNFIGGTVSSTVSAYWFIRHGAKDRDTSFLVPINLATKLQNFGVEVDFALPWNRSHSGDYNLDELFEWIKRIASIQ